MLHSPQILLTPRKAAVVAAPAASAWDPSGHGTDISLSTTTAANDTAMTSTGTWDVVRGTASKTTGKLAFEIIILSVSGGSVMFGLNDQATAGGAGLTGVFKAPDGIWQWDNGSSFAEGADFSAIPVSSFPLFNGTILGVQADLTAGKVWFSQDGVSMGGNPVAGTGNMGTIANNHSVCPSIAMITSISAQLVTGTLTHPTSGFSSWG